MNKERIHLLMVLLESVERFLTQVEEMELNGNLLQRAKSLKPVVEKAKKMLEEEAKGN